jgi:hypothetical protein
MTARTHLYESASGDTKIRRSKMAVVYWSEFGSDTGSLTDVAWIPSDLGLVSLERIYSPWNLTISWSLNGGRCCITQALRARLKYETYWEYWSMWAQYFQYAEVVEGGTVSLITVNNWSASRKRESRICSIYDDIQIELWIIIPCQKAHLWSDGVRRIREVLLFAASSLQAQFCTHRW